MRLPARPSRWRTPPPARSSPMCRRARRPTSTLRWPQRASPWSKMVPAERARLLWKLSDMLEAQAEEFALIETLDNGKPYRNALNMDLKTCVENLRYNAGWATKLNGETMTPSNPANLLSYTL